MTLPLFHTTRLRTAAQTASFRKNFPIPLLARACRARHMPEPAFAGRMSARSTCDASRIPQLHVQNPPNSVQRLGDGLPAHGIAIAIELEVFGVCNMATLLPDRK